MENIARPQCFAAMGDLYPENFICYANSDSKFRLFDVDSFGIRKTIAAPVRGVPVVWLVNPLDKYLGSYLRHTLGLGLITFNIIFNKRRKEDK